MKKKRISDIVLRVFFLFCMIVVLAACERDSDVYLEEYVTETGAKESEDTGDFQAEQSQLAEQEELAAEMQLCYVYVCGAVLHPDVYALPEGSRIYEAIQMAGGLTDDADATAVNQAEIISDGQMIRIYTYEETKESQANHSFTDQKEAVEDGRVNINTASREVLMTLPGIGSSKADAIIAYREEHGAFSDIEELMNIPGIKEGIFLQIKEHIKINDERIE